MTAVIGETLAARRARTLGAVMLPAGPGRPTRCRGSEIGSVVSRTRVAAVGSSPVGFGVRVARPGAVATPPPGSSASNLVATW